MSNKRWTPMVRAPKSEYYVTSCTIMSVDLSKWLRAGKKGGSTGIQTHGLWLSVSVLCH